MTPAWELKDFEGSWGDAMQSPGSVTRWIDAARDGCERAATELWQRYHPQLMELARQKLTRASRRMADEEDVVVCAFESYFRRSREGEFAQLSDRHQLWKLLVVITTRKAFNHLRLEFRHKRNARIAGCAPLDEDVPIEELLGQLVSSDAQPDFVVLAGDLLQHLLDNLAEDELQSIALARLIGCSVEEIARDLGRSRATIMRRLGLIRDIWEAGVTP